MCIYICIYVCLCLYLFYLDIRTYMYICVYIRMYLCIHIYIYIYMNTCRYIYICVCMQIHPMVYEAARDMCLIRGLTKTDKHASGSKVSSGCKTMRGPRPNKILVFQAGSGAKLRLELLYELSSTIAGSDRAILGTY